MMLPRPKNAYQKVMEKTIRARIPFFAMWELTYRCNLLCVHCYRVEDKRRKELSTAQGIALLRQLADEGTLNLTFTGGEPLLRKDFFELAENARNLNFALRIFTNGTLITRQTARRIWSLSPDSVHISLYAVEEPLFEQITRVKGSYAKVMQAIDHLRERGVRVVLKTPLMNLNFSQFHRLKKIAREKTCEIVFDTKITPKNDGSPTPMCYQIEEDALEALFRKVGDAKPVQKVPSDWAPCNAGFNLTTISPYGQVFPCVQLRLEAGNVKHKSFRNIWRNSSVMTKVRNAKISDSLGCFSCKYGSWCVRCPGMAYVETGSMYAPSPIACKEARIRKRIILSAISGRR